MAVSVTINSGTGTFQGGTFNIGPLIIASAFASLQVNSITFASGTFVSTTGPAGAYGVLIEPPAANLIQLTLKGITGDTGIPISPNLPTLIPFFAPASANAVGLTSAAAIPTGVVTLTFF
jgi:hypothetical protein